jgi:hypothetical protein
MAANLENEKEGLASIKEKKEGLLSKVKGHGTGMKEKEEADLKEFEEKTKKATEELENKLKALEEQGKSAEETMTKAQETDMARLEEDTGKEMDTLKETLKEFKVKTKEVLEALGKASKDSEGLQKDNAKKYEEDKKKEDKVNTDAQALYDTATAEIKTAHEEGKALQEEIVTMQEKQQTLETTIGESSEKAAAGSVGKKQTEEWIAARLAKVAADTAKKAEEEKEAKENQGTFECEDGTMVFDSINCPDAGPGAKERAAAAKKEKEEAKKKLQEEADKVETETKANEDKALEEFTKALEEAEGALKKAEEELKTLKTDMAAKTKELEEKNTLIDEKEKIRAEQSMVMGQSQEKLDALDTQWRATEAGHNDIDSGIVLRTDAATEHEKEKLRELEDAVVAMKLTHKALLKSTKTSHKEALDELKARVEEGVKALKKDLKEIKTNCDLFKEEQKTKNGGRTKESDALAEQIRNVAKSAKATLKAHGQMKMETLEAQKAEAEQAATLEKEQALEALRHAASLELKSIEEWKVMEDKHDSGILATLTKARAIDDEAAKKSQENFDALESDLKLKENIMLDQTRKETMEIEKARNDNYQLEQLKMAATSACGDNDEGCGDNGVALEDSLKDVKQDLEETVAMKEDKTNAEAATEASYTDLQKESQEVEQSEDTRRDELEHLERMSEANRGGSVPGDGVQRPEMRTTV